MAYDPERNFESFGPDHNIQNYVASHNNLNAAPFVQRTRHMCGIAENQYLSTCSDFSACFDDYSTLEDWVLCMEVNVHANMHEWHGGAFNCAYDLKEVQNEYPVYGTDLLLFLGTVAHDVWYIYESVTIAQYMSCPSSCDEGSTDATSGCSCYCTMEFDDMDEASLISIMHDTLYTLQFIFYEGRDYIKYDEEIGRCVTANPPPPRLGEPPVVLVPSSPSGLTPCFSCGPSPPPASATRTATAACWITTTTSGSSATARASSARAAWPGLWARAPPPTTLSSGPCTRSSTAPGTC